MGLYNKSAGPLAESLKNGKCPFCGSSAEPIDVNKEEDSYEYKCEHCNPNCVIAISGTIVGDIDSKIKGQVSLSYLTNKIKGCSQGRISIISKDFA